LSSLTKLHEPKALWHATPKLHLKTKYEGYDIGLAFSNRNIFYQKSLQSRFISFNPLKLEEGRVVPVEKFLSYRAKELREGVK